ncbi:dihydropteroate synthase [Laribacter hongkongensis]|uniref:dihydropteroate synthase n=1 Tax=Laribacter hongkongensis TaxID=168471 RepID=UPI001EFCF94C|nr:dihydropteroate synthase [Laribacter hongkongensis]MCG9119466.1 dihydropteroate synthase [Laribacter hongkongensis]
MTHLACGRYRLSLDRPLVMGILNVTPDSFSDGGRFQGRDAALAQADRLMAEGADLLDIGGESTRPNAPIVSASEEADRVLPVLEALQGCGVPLSLDTRKTAVMQAGLALGVDLINDIAALEDDGALALLAACPAAICLMHKQGDPATMQQQPRYARVQDEVHAYLSARVAACLAAGIAAERLLVDPGFGFGKTVMHNYQLLDDLPRLGTLAPVLVGMSRKSMLGAVTGVTEPAARTVSSVVAAVLAAERGAAVVRVHDVAATREGLAVWQALKDAGLARN